MPRKKKSVKPQVNTAGGPPTSNAPPAEESESSEKEILKLRLAMDKMAEQMAITEQRAIRAEEQAEAARATASMSSPDMTKVEQERRLAIAKANGVEAGIYWLTGKAYLKQIGDDKNCLYHGAPTAPIPLVLPKFYLRSVQLPKKNEKGEIIHDNKGRVMYSKEREEIVRETAKDHPFLREDQPPPVKPTDIHPNAKMLRSENVMLPPQLDKVPSAAEV